MLAHIFDEATTPAEREIAIRALKRLTGKDRSDLAAKYARRPPDPPRQRQSPQSRQRLNPSLNLSWRRKSRPRQCRPAKALAAGMVSIFVLIIICDLGLAAIHSGSPELVRFIVICVVVALWMMAGSDRETFAKKRK